MKYVFLGVVSSFDFHKDSDGKIIVKRVCKKQKTKAISITKTFVSDFITTDNIKNGEWYKFLPDLCCMSEIPLKFLLVGKL